MAAVPVPWRAAGGNVSGMVSHQRRAAALATMASALLVPISVVAALADDRFGCRVAICRSAGSPALAARMSSDIRAALSLRHGTVAAPVPDDSGLWCVLDGGGRHDSASTMGAAKVLLMETVLRGAQELGRRLARFEPRTARPVSTGPDHGPARRL